MDEVEMELYLIRHAESVMNTQDHLIGGRSNETPLTETGILQAKRLGVYLLEREIFPDFVHVSPAVRTRATAEHSLEVMGVTLEPIINDGLQELDQGQWVGRNRVEIYTPAVLAEIDRLGKDFKADGGESTNEAGQRMFSSLLAPFEGHVPPRKPERHFVYTHGAAIRCLLAKILGWTQQETYEARTMTDNTSMTLMSRINDIWTVDYIGRQPR